MKRKKQIKIQVRIIRSPSSAIPLVVSLSIAGALIADTRSALNTSVKRRIRPFNTFPVKMSIFLSWNGPDHASYCPYKGDSSYYSVPAGGKKSVMPSGRTRIRYPAVAQR